MRRILFGVFLFIVFAWVVLYFLNPQTVKNTSPSAIVSPTNFPPPQQPEALINYGGKSYAFSSFSSNEPSKILVIGNYEKKRSSGSIVQEYGCLSAINGGFYTESYSPIGLFIEKSETKSPREENPLFNGLFYLGRDNQMGIGRDLPKTNIVYALQTGPILIERGSPLELKLREDELARRSVILTDTQGTVYFLSVYNPESVYEGPLLSQLPTIVSLYAQEKGIPVDMALNLDGASASYFMNSDTVLSELTPVGSIICLVQ